jgi:Flp pilus assembly protein TadB
MDVHEREPAGQRDAAGEDAHTPSTISLSKGYWFLIGLIAALALIVGVAWVALLGWFVLRVLAWLFGT